MRVSSLLIVLFVLSLLSCDNKNQQIKDLEDAVIGVHDEIMPRHGELNKLKIKALNIADSLSAAGSADSTTYYNAVTLLDQAGTDMMDWMRAYETDLSALEHEEKVVYLQNEKDKIIKVKNNMIEALDKAKSLNLE